MATSVDQLSIEGKTQEQLEEQFNKMDHRVLAPNSQQKQDFLFKVIIIGDSGVGKSCVLHRLTHNEFIEDHEVTVGVEFGSLLVQLNEKVYKLQIWDTAGQEAFKSVTKVFYRGAHCILLTYDITKKDSFEHLSGWMKEIREQSDSDVNIFLIGNMLDNESDR